MPDISNLITVSPSVEKLDIERWNRDIPKYYPYLQPKSRIIWDKFLEQQLSDLTSESSSTDYQDQFRQLIAAGNKPAHSSCAHKESVTNGDSSSSSEEEVV